MKVSISFDRDWIVSDGGVHSFAVSLIISSLIHKFGRENIKIDREGMSECSLNIAVDEQAADENAKNELKANPENYLRAEAMKAAGLEDASKCKVTVEEEQGEGKETLEQQLLRQLTAQLGGGSKPGTDKQPEAPKGEPEKKAEERTSPKPPEGEAQTKEQPRDEEAAEETLKEIDALVGSTRFKELCHEIHRRAISVRRDGTQEVFRQDAYLFAINEGEGFTNALTLFSRLLNDEKLLTVPERPQEITLPPHEKEHIEEIMADLAGKLENVLMVKRVIAFDITGWMNHTASATFKKFLFSLLRNNKAAVIVFRTRALSDKMLRQTLEDLNDLISTLRVNFDPFSNEELHTLAEKMLSAYDFTVENEAWEIFDRRMRKERSDGFFYGMHTIRKTVNEMIRYTESYEGEGSKLITAEKIEQLCPAHKQETQSALEELNAMIGGEEIKKSLMFAVAQIEMIRSGKIKGSASMHMCFTGNPGTGKTTVARILGDMLREKNILRIGKFYEYKGRDLCGRYIGETAPKTTQICREAYGSVLFIDEAYSLYRDNDNGRDYGREAIDTLVAEMENHSDDLIVILAGYPQDMDTMLSGNVGLKSRIPYMIHFPSYTGEQLSQIFMKMVEGNFEVSDTFEQHAKEYFTSIPRETIEKDDFGNGRFVRNIYERTWGKASLRSAEQGDEKVVLDVQDFDEAVRELNVGIPVKKTEKRKIGF